MFFVCLVLLSYILSTNQISAGFLKVQYLKKKLNHEVDFFHVGGHQETQKINKVRFDMVGHAHYTSK